MKRRLLDALLQAHVEGETAVLATDLESGAQALVFPPSEAGRPPLTEGLEVGPDLAGAIDIAATTASSVTVEGPGGPVFLRVYAPLVRLVIVGAVHIAQPLAAMARAAGFQVVVVDPRRAFATEERFPGIEIRHAWPREAMESLGLNRRTGVVTLSHDPKLDDPALHAALESPAFYVGALGSSRTHRRRLQRLEKAGVSADRLERIHGPVGLDLGGDTPGEIAVSILAQFVRALHGGG